MAKQLPCKGCTRMSRGKCNCPIFAERDKLVDSVNELTRQNKGYALTVKNMGRALARMKTEWKHDVGGPAHDDIETLIKIIKQKS